MKLTERWFSCFNANLTSIHNTAEKDHFSMQPCNVNLAEENMQCILNTATTICPSSAVLQCYQ